MARLFFALWPESDIQAELAEIIKGTLHHPSRLVPNKHIHMTVVFLGNVEDRAQSTIISQACRIRASNFVLNIDQHGWWKRPKICWVAPSYAPPALFRISDTIRQIAQQLKLPMEHRPFIPHITLARKTSRPLILKFKPIHWEVRKFCLIESLTHPGEVEYKIIQQWPLTLK